MSDKRNTASLIFSYHLSLITYHPLILPLILSPASGVESAPPRSRVVSPAATHSRTARSTAAGRLRVTEVF